jgi:hypothetical protein
LLVPSANIPGLATNRFRSSLSNSLAIEERGDERMNPLVLHFQGDISIEWSL